MNSKININKNGSYILETALSLPIFLVAIIVMNSIILMFACIENSNFIIANEMRKASAEAIYVNTSSLVPVRTINQIKESSEVTNANLIDYGYDLSWWGNDHLIAMKIRIDMQAKNPINLGSKASYDVAMITRAYVGKKRNVSKMSEADMMNQDETAVFIFPKRGEKYHIKNCSFLKATTKATALSDTIKKKYSPCPICHSKKASNGTIVYYFPEDGESYHFRDCATIERNYIEISKEVAIERGYTPCLKCGG